MQKRRQGTTPYAQTKNGGWYRSKKRAGEIRKVHEGKKNSHRRGGKKADQQKKQENTQKTVDAGEKKACDPDHIKKKNEAVQKRGRNQWKKKH